MKKILASVILLLATAYLVTSFLPRKPKTAFDVAGFGRLPVLVNGRIKPMDTVARTSLLMMQGRQSIKTPEGVALSPVEWLLDVLFRPEKADTYRHFEVTHPDALALLGLTTGDGDGGKRFSLAQLQPKLAELERQAKLAEQVEAAVRTTFQKAVVNLREHVVLYFRLKQSLVAPDSQDFLSDLEKFSQAIPSGVAAVRARSAGQPHDEAAAREIINAASKFKEMADYGYTLAIPPPPQATDPKAWKTAGQALLETFQTGQINPSVMAYAGMGYAWRQQRADQFNTIVKLFRETLTTRFATELKKSDVETKFNAAEPFYRSSVLFAFAFVLAIFSWLKWPDVLQRSAAGIVILAWIATTLGIATRMWLEGRPPVTNLYSSALFVGWGAVGLCIILEAFFRNAIGAAAGALAGGCALIVAHHLSLSGDTLEMMRAVLDSNFWLATHVVVVTLGYAATFLAGFLALLYIVLGLLTPWLGRPFTRGPNTTGAARAGVPATASKAAKLETNGDAIGRMVYGIICFATLFSFVGTILGGIWADQSWGRFWGWDPKENGALIIVLWNAIILHCRWGGLVRQRGLMALAIFGNIVTAWSWFGTNMLGVGLHSYGFMDQAFLALIAFVFSQLVLIALANIPLAKWRSFQVRAT